jgi:putative hydrolase of the HAD superfamily
MIRAVLFDLDGTLLDRDASALSFVRNQHHRYHRELGHVAREAYVSRFVDLDARGYVWKDIVYQQLVVEFGISKLSWEHLLRDYEDRFHKHCKPYTELVESLDTLRRTGFELGVITNGYSEFQLANIKALGIEHFFSQILVSESEGVRKPEPEIFKRAVERLGVGPEEAVFIGDHPVNDIQAARNVGLKTIWKRDSSWPNADAHAVVDELWQLPQIISTL